MEDFLDILKYVLPSLVVLAASLLTIKKFMDAEQRKHIYEIRKENQKITTPLRLQSYERLILFLERISPENLILRVHKPGMSAKMLQSNLITIIKSEFDHNLTQQVYISSSSWEIIKKVKDDIIKAVNIAAGNLPPDAKGTDLGQKLFEVMSKLEKSPTQVAIGILKNEIRQLF
ncbi:MAG: hypothetical protein COW67_11845 [Flavobacteriales bacterium CG18_big_fil_WC_8_21_14_2_50_32_9]|nr:MAG: hypothetical protein COW67_11845 [Flavobacteriales bacterium CG18_big_fil_WC_8_21_14_2_50_32_9]PJC62937.1 MAG: hypothetical protein CO022_01890 [Flavobacteriales bacterium CG_4_9_14_0_2_um_filter_32_27]